MSRTTKKPTLTVHVPDANLASHSPFAPSVSAPISSVEYRRLARMDIACQARLRRFAGWNTLADWPTPRNRTGNQPREKR